jgi:hypothetical protein
MGGWGGGRGARATYALEGFVNGGEAAGAYFLQDVVILNSRQAHAAARSLILEPSHLIPAGVPPTPATWCDATSLPRSLAPSFPRPRRRRGVREPKPRALRNVRPRHSSRLRCQCLRTSRSRSTLGTAPSVGRSDWRRGSKVGTEEPYYPGPTKYYGPLIRSSLGPNYPGPPRLIIALRWPPQRNTISLLSGTRIALVK